MTRFQRRVDEDRVTVGVDVGRERVRVSRRIVVARPAREEEIERAFREQTLRVPVFGEQPAPRKKAFVTGEVVVHRRLAEPVAVAETADIRAEPTPDEHQAETTADDHEAETAPMELVEPAQVAEPVGSAEPVEVAGVQVAPLSGIRRVLEEVRAGWVRARSGPR